MPDSSTQLSTARLGAPPVLEVVRQSALDLLLTGAPLDGPLAQLVELDAVLSGLLMRLIRCPLYEGAALRGTRVPDAMERVGRPALVHAVEFLPGLRDHETREVVERACHDWVHGLAVAAAARWLAGTGEYEDPHESFVAGLLHDVGARCGSPGGDSIAAARRLAQRWHLSDRVAMVACAHETAHAGFTPESLGMKVDELDARQRRLWSVVVRACRIARYLGYSSRPPARDVEISVLAEAAAESVALELTHAAALLGLERTSPSDLVRVLANEEVRLGEKVDERRELGTDTELLAAAHRRIVGARRMSSVADIVAMGLLEIREGLELDRVILLEPHPSDQFRLQGRAVSDPSEMTYAGGVHGVSVELDGGGTLQQAMERGRAVLGGCDSRDARVKQQLGVESFAGAVLQAGNTPMGLVIADRFLSGEPVSRSDVVHLELLCDTLGIVLDNKVLDLQGRKLRTLAEKDELTGINNRRNIVSILGTEIRRARRFGNPLSIALLDVDHFKRWNDVHGHQVGDVVLQAVAQLIAACSREIDHYGRYGGEEFLVVLPETSIQHSVLYAERLRVTLEGHGADMFTQYSETPLSVSIGVSSLRDEDDIETLVRRADEALYEAKNTGRNRVCIEARADQDGLVEDTVSGPVDVSGSDPAADASASA
jgi:diguanylate cyclase (GGDEF)-like protein